MQRNFGYIGEKQDKSGVYTTGVLGGIFHLDTTKFTSPRFLGQDLASSYYQIASNRTIQTGSSGDSANNWDVAEVQCGNTGSYRLYLVAKQTTSTTYYNDICVAAVQHLSSSNTTKNIWVFN